MSTLARSTSRLHLTLSDAGIPIVSVRYANGAASVVYADNATAQQQTAGAAIVAAFDWSDAADAVFWLARAEGNEPDLAALRSQATQAVADINTFLAIASPSNAQVLAEVKAIDQRQRAIIKALARLVAKTL